MITNRIAAGRDARRYAFLAALLCALVAGGCGLFQTRDPYDPIGDIPRHVPNDPDSVIFNFETAVAYKTAGTSLYSEALGVDFIMFMSPVDASRLGIPSVLKVDVEPAHRDFLTLRVKSSAVRLTMDTDRVRPLITGNTAFYDDLPYEIDIYTKSGENEVITEKVAGEVDLFVVRQESSGLWAMQEWHDLPDTSSATETYGYYIGYYSGQGAPIGPPK